MQNFTKPFEIHATVPVSFLRSKKLTAGEKVAMIVVNSLPENWEFSVKGICQFFSEGRDAVYEIFRSLERKGFLTKKPTVTGGYHYTFHQSPVEILNSLVFCAKNVQSPVTGKPEPENQEQSIKSKIQRDKEKPPSVLKTCIKQPIAGARPQKPENAQAVSIGEQVVDFRLELKGFQDAFPGKYPTPFYNKFFRYYRQTKTGGLIARNYYQNFDLQAKLLEWWADTKPEIKKNWWFTHSENL